MTETDEKRFLVIVIRDLLGLCEHKPGKNNKAVVASNIMCVSGQLACLSSASTHKHYAVQHQLDDVSRYVVGQYPRFLRQHWKFLKTVVLKLFEVRFACALLAAERASGISPKLTLLCPALLCLCSSCMRSTQACKTWLVTHSSRSLKN